MTDLMDFLSRSSERQTCKLSFKFRSFDEQLHRQQHAFLISARMVRRAGSRPSAVCGSLGWCMTAGATASWLGSCEEARARRCGPASTAWNVPRHRRSNTNLLFSRRDALFLCILLKLLTTNGRLGFLTLRLGYVMAAWPLEDMLGGGAGRWGARLHGRAAGNGPATLLPRQSVAAGTTQPRARCANIGNLRRFSKGTHPPTPLCDNKPTRGGTNCFVVSYNFAIRNIVAQNTLLYDLCLF